MTEIERTIIRAVLTLPSKRECDRMIRGMERATKLAEILTELGLIKEWTFRHYLRALREWRAVRMVWDGTVTGISVPWQGRRTCD